MGKKSRSKRSAKSKAMPIVQTVENQSEVIKREVKAVEAASLSSSTTKKTATPDTWTEHIRTDIVRILLLLAIVGLSLIILMVLNQKTPYLIDMGTRLSEFLRLS